VIVGYAGAKQLRKRHEGTGGLGFIDSSGKRTGDIVLDAHPESFQLEKSGSRIFVNVPEKKEIEVIDAAKHSVLARWTVSAEDNFPMALDEAHHRLLLGVWKPPQLLVFDTQTGKQVAAGEIAGKTNDLFYDSVRSRVYVLTSLGYLEVFEQKDADHYNRIARYETASRSQTGLFVPEWGRLFVAVQKKAGSPLSPNALSPWQQSDPVFFLAMIAPSCRLLRAQSRQTGDRVAPNYSQNIHLAHFPHRCTGRERRS
jgi:hypothetical protein